MTEIETEGLTTDLIETGDVETTPTDTEIETVETTETEQVPEFVETGVEGDDDEPPSNVADVQKLIQDGDTEAALKRLSEIDKGIEKLKYKPEQVRNEVLTEISGFYDAVAAGDTDAIDALDREIFGKKGTSLKAVFAASIGLDADDIDVLLDGGEVQQKAPQSNKELEALKAEVQAIKQSKLDAEWSANYGSAIQKYLRDATELDIPVEVLAQARHLFPKKASPDDIQEAVMQVNPRAYRTALSAKGSAKTTPASATVSRGGKGSSLPSADELLSDPAKLEAYLAANRR
jgi:phage tail protein X